MDQSPDVCFVFDVSVLAPGDARRAIAALFADPNDTIAGRVLLTISELVTNAVLHSDGGGVVRAWDPGPDGRLRIEVEDYSIVAPASRQFAGTESNSSPVVNLACSAWGVIPTAVGKIVWAEFDRT